MIERRHQARSRQKIHSIYRERFGDLFAPDRFGDCILLKFILKTVVKWSWDLCRSNEYELASFCVI